MKDSISLQHKKNKEYYPLAKDTHLNLKEIIIPHAEIIQVQDKTIPHPSDRIQVKGHSFKEAKATDNKENDPRLPAEHEKFLEIYKLFPPVIINLREDAKAGHIDSRDQLSPAEINYFQKRNSTALLFIHGFNLSYGDYSQQIIGINKTEGIRQSQTHLDSADKLLLRSESLSTLYKSQSSLEQNLNQGEAWPFRLSDEDLNGMGAHNWFIHMEHNINSAKQNTDTLNYTHYKRLIHIAWSGDLPPYNYLDAEETANRAGKRLVKLIHQLIEHGIKIYIIAHSLGTRVLLNSMQSLAENNKQGCLSQVFLWQAAVADSALSNDKRRDHSVKNNNHFPEAYLAAKKISVLYSKNDWVLEYYYFLANRIGISAKQFFSPKEAWDLLYRFMDENPFEVLAFAKLAEGDIKSIANLGHKDKDVDLLIRILKECYRLSKGEQAMGYHGVDLKDPFMHELIKGGQLILANQSHLSGHSAMKIPNAEMMELVYKRWIINSSRGIKDF